MPVVRNIFAGLFWRATAELGWELGWNSVGTQLELSWKSSKLGICSRRVFYSISLSAIEKG